MKSIKQTDPSMKDGITKIFVNDWSPYCGRIQLQIGLTLLDHE